MKSYSTVIVSLLLTMALACAVGCKKDPNSNNDNGVSLPEGVIGGVYSVSATDKVCFSQGNLQYQA